MKKLFLRIWNFWPPYWGAGIKFENIGDDLMSVRTRLKRRPWTSNYVGTQFGGSIYAMTDPVYMFMLINQLGREYIVWDKAASIRFRKPGRTDLVADFHLTKEDIDEVKRRLETEPKIDWEKQVLVKDTKGETIAEVHKIIYIKRKSGEGGT